MKRSEMLKLLEFYIYNTEHIDVPTSDYIKEKPMAREILELIEKAGMAPPGYMKPIPFYEGKQYPLIPGDFKNDQGIWCTPGIKEWEPED